MPCIIVVNFVYKAARQLFSGNHKIISDWFIFSLWSRGFTIFLSWTPKCLLSNSKAVNTCEDKKKKQIVPVLK